MKNNICILFIFLLSLGIVSVVNAFESPIYSLDMDVNAEGINVNINSDIEFNITNETEETAPIISNSAGSITNSKNKRNSNREEFLLSELNNEFSTENRNTINLNYNTGSEETASQTEDNLTKLGVGVLVLSVLAAVSIFMVILLLKNKTKK